MKTTVTAAFLSVIAFVASEIMFIHLTSTLPGSHPWVRVIVP